MIVFSGADDVILEWLDPHSRVTSPPKVKKNAQIFKKLKTRSLPAFLKGSNSSIALISAEMANQWETKNHISYCVTASSHMIHMGTHEHHSISSACIHMCLCKPPSTLPHNTCVSCISRLVAPQLSRWITDTKFCNLYMNKYGIYIRATWNQPKSCMRLWLAMPGLASYG